MIDRLYNEKEAAEYLGISIKKLKRMVAEKKAPAYKLGGKFLRFDKKCLDEAKVFLASAGELMSRSRYPLLARVFDYFYYNDFYIIVIVLIVILLAIVFKVSF